MKGHSVLMSSRSDEWETPATLFMELGYEFYLTLDVAASSDNRKCREYYGLDHPVYSDGLIGGWLDRLKAIGSVQGACWMNPPYSRGLQAKFIRKAAQERLRGVLTVALLPARTDTKVFHECIYDASKWQARPGIEIRLLPGRLKFGGATNGAPFPSMIVVFRPESA